MGDYLLSQGLLLLSIENEDFDLIENHICCSAGDESGGADCRLKKREKISTLQKNYITTSSVRKQLRFTGFLLAAAMGAQSVNRPATDEGS